MTPGGIFDTLISCKRGIESRPVWSRRQDGFACARVYITYLPTEARPQVLVRKPNNHRRLREALVT